MDSLTIQKWLWKWSLKSGVISIGGFLTMSSLSYFLYYTIEAAASPDASELSRAHITAGLILITICVCLFWGGIKENRMFLIPGLMFGGSLINIMVFILLTYSLVNPYALLFVFAITPLIYCWMCVYSYYLELDPRRMQFTSNAVISYAGATPDLNEPVKLPEVV